MNITLLGASGNMGQSVMKTLLDEDYIEKINILGHSKKGIRKIKKIIKNSNKTKLIIGSINNLESLKESLINTDIVINMASIIPPLSDKNPLLAKRVNEDGVINLIKAIKEVDENIKLIHISTVALYGNRNNIHPYARVGDPLLICPFDIYSLTKLRGEFHVLESGLKNFVILRQTALLYDKLFKNNIKDGLMYHTVFNSPLEWSTSLTSALLIKNLLKKDNDGLLDNNNFYRRVYNIGGGKENRKSGYESLNAGFKILNASVDNFFKPNYSTTRNFHGVYFLDDDVLNNLFDFEIETVEQFYNNLEKKHPIYKLGKIVPKFIIRNLIFKRLLKDENSPVYWYKHNDEARLFAFFKGKDEYEKIPKSFSDYECDLVKYQKNNKVEINHYFDISKDIYKITMDDLINVANAHGGKLLNSSYSGDPYEKLRWLNTDGVIFFASAYTILFAGHWWTSSYFKYEWNYDYYAKKDKIFAQLYYDSHDRNEDKIYYFDDEFKAHMKDL